LASCDFAQKSPRHRGEHVYPSVRDASRPTTFELDQKKIGTHVNPKVIRLGGFRYWGDWPAPDGMTGDEHRTLRFGINAADRFKIIAAGVWF
jgi:hypothetical protein